MLNTILLLAFLLVLAIIFIIFRVSTLVGVIKGDTKKTVATNNKTNAALLLVFMILGIVGFFYYSFGGLDDDFVQPVASEHGVITERLFWITMGITVAVFIITQIFLFGFSYKYQHKDNRKAFYYPHNNNLELLWTAVPAVLVPLVLF